MDKLSNYGDIPYAQNIRTLFSVKPLIMYCGRPHVDCKKYINHIFGISNTLIGSLDPS